VIEAALGVGEIFPERLGRLVRVRCVDFEVRIDAADTLAMMWDSLLQQDTIQANAGVAFRVLPRNRWVRSESWMPAKTVGVVK